MSFPTSADGWALGDACDAQQTCAIGVARTTDGGSTWAMVTSVGHPNPNGAELSLTAASSEDAWVWGTDSDGQPVFVATHDGGATWQPVNAGAAVVDISVASGTAWALTACPQAGGTCAIALLSAPVGGGPWTDLPSLPTSVQGAPVSNALARGPELVRSGLTAWVLNDNQSPPALVSTDDGGQTWSSLPLPCATFGSLFLGASSAKDLMLVCADDGTSSPAAQEVWTSGDGGATWVIQSRDNETSFSPPLPDLGSLNNGGDPYGLMVVSDTSAWMINHNEDDLVSHDNGVTWANVPLPANLTSAWQGGAEVDITFADALHGWIFSKSGLWVTTDGGTVWTAQPIIGVVPGA